MTPTTCSWAAFALGICLGVGVTILIVSWIVGFKRAGQHVKRITATMPKHAWVTAAVLASILGWKPAAAPQTSSPSAFSRLPPELRTMIWELAVSSPRNIKLKHNNDINETVNSPVVSATVPAMLHTCRESRATALKHFQPLRIFGLRYYLRDTGTLMYFNKDEDTLSFASWDDFTSLVMHNVNFWDLQANLLDAGVRNIEIMGYDELRARDYRALYMLSDIMSIALWEPKGGKEAVEMIVEAYKEKWVVSEELRDADFPVIKFVKGLMENEDKIVQ